MATRTRTVTATASTLVSPPATSRAAVVTSAAPMPKGSVDTLPITWEMQ